MHLVSFLSHVHSSKTLWEQALVQDFANTSTRPNTVTKCTRSKPCEHMHSFRTRWAHAITQNLQADALVQDCIPPESYEPCRWWWWSAPPPASARRRSPPRTGRARAPAPLQQRPRVTIQHTQPHTHAFSRFWCQWHYNMAYTYIQLDILCQLRCARSKWLALGFSCTFETTVDTRQQLKIAYRW